MEENEVMPDKVPQTRVWLQQVIGGFIGGGLCMTLLLVSRALGAWFIGGPLLAPAYVVFMTSGPVLQILPEAQTDMIIHWLDKIDPNMRGISIIISCIPPFLIGFLYPKKEYHGVVGVILVMYLGIVFLDGLCYIALKGSVLDN